MIPLFAIREAIEPLLAEVARAQRAVLDSGRYVLGPQLEAFEAEFAAHLSARHCIGVASGTDALTIALRAIGLRPGDEVVIPAFSFFATAEAVVNAGARPVFCDIDAATHCMTAATAEPAIGERTRALLPVHLFGNPAPMAELLELANEHDLIVLEDAAQAAGARLDGRAVGTSGRAAGFSFYPGKNLGAFGDGGAIVTDDGALAARARLLRNHGSEGGWTHTEVGYNSRLDELQAAALRVLLPHLEGWTQARREVAGIYASGLPGQFGLPVATPGAEPAHHLFVVLAAERDAVIERLAASGVEARAYYHPPLHRQPAMAPYADGPPCPHADRLATENVALPMGPALAEADAHRVCEAVASALAGAGVR